MYFFFEIEIEASRIVSSRLLKSDWLVIFFSAARVPARQSSRSRLMHSRRQVPATFPGIDEQSRSLDPSSIRNMICMINYLKNSNITPASNKCLVSFHTSGDEYSFSKISTPSTKK